MVLQVCCSINNERLNSKQKNSKQKTVNKLRYHSAECSPFYRCCLLYTSKYNVVAKYSYDEYPGNPNGSDYSIAALASADGRHLAIMPHLERSIFP